MNTTNQQPTAQPVVAPAIPWYKSQVQIAQVTAFIVGLAALFPKSALVAALGLTNPEAVSTLVSQIFGVISFAALGWGIIARQFSKVQRLTMTLDTGSELHINTSGHSDTNRDA